MNFENKIVLVTGASGGIGKSVSLELAERNAEVVMAARSMEKLEKAKQWILAKQPKAKLRLLEVDLSSIDSISKAVNRLENMVNRLDVLINNAALIDPSSKEKRESVDGHELMIATNFLGPVLLSKLCMSLLRRAEHGHVLNVSSIAVWKFFNPNKKLNFIAEPEHQRDYTGIEYYADSKMALAMYSLHMSEALAEEDISVNPLILTNVQYDPDKTMKLNLAHTLFNNLVKPFKLSRKQASRLYLDVIDKQDDLESVSQAFASNRKFAKLPAFAREQENLDSLVSFTEKALTT